MKHRTLIVYAILFSAHAFAQNCSEFEKHSKSIDSTYLPGYILDRTDTVFNANRAFLDYTIANLLEKPSDTCFVSNRYLLRRLPIMLCDGTNIKIGGKLKHGATCKITITAGKFELANHQIDSNEDTSNIARIDGQFPYGGQYSMPKIEIKFIQIEIAGIKLNIPNEAYSNFYNPLICNNYGFGRRIEVYESLNGDYLYLYVYGGDAAGFYFAKLIFDKEKYLARIVSDYKSLSMYGAFRKNFIGF